MAENGDGEHEFTNDSTTFDDVSTEGLGTDDVDVSPGDTTEDTNPEDPELEAIKARVREMEEEAEKLKEMQNEVDKQMNLSTTSSSGLTSPLSMSMEEKIDADARSIHVANVDYGATAEELEQHFHGCGSINRVTILCDKYTGHPKGFAYIEFADKDSVTTAQALNDSLFRGRQIAVMVKRTNRPGISSTNRPPRGRGRGRGRGYNPYFSSSFSSSYRPRGRGMYRPRRPWYSPY
ncbi:polyadenylate-binding protein 2-like [Tubulanus polymorphus]|uniref:polyadenylate-binding protein 2-like n=1 Tax=Tubulanus polymorphus TaxID=672921 RepID=UPI003DA539C4